MPIKQGDIYWIRIKKSETVGSEQFKDRPWVVVSRSELNRSNMIVGVPLTTNQARACGHRIAIPLGEIIKEAGEPFQFSNCVALTDQIRALALDRFPPTRMGRLSQSATIAVVEQGLAYLFDIPVT